MGYAVGYNSSLDRDIGYGVPALCDHPGCRKRIHRGLSYVCGGEPYGGERGCGLHFCERHLVFADHGPLCARCEKGKPHFHLKPDLPEWIGHKLTDETWAQWRAEHPAFVEAHAGVLEDS